MPSIETAIDKLLPEIVAFRHDLHENPEIGYEERETSRKVAERLEKEGCFSIRKNVARTGIVATLGADKQGAGIALRADMDCLPILEETDKPWASKRPGLMHACGHDGHTSCLLGTALTLAQFQDKLDGPVAFLFQPAEEGGAGGEKMIQEGALDDPRIEKVFGLHGWPSLPLGEIATCSGPMMANADGFNIWIRGKGGHAAFPQNCINPIDIASQLVPRLHKLSSDSTVVTVGKISGGTAFNIIPGTAALKGTIRTLSNETQEQVHQEIETLSQETAAALGGHAEVDIIHGYPVLNNDAQAHAYLKETFAAMGSPVTAVRDLSPQMVAEDFAYMALKKPACFYFIGLRPIEADSYPGLHQADFDFNDNAIPIAMRSLAELALRFR